MKIGTTELILILAVVVIVFGPSNIPKLTKMFGESIKSFKKGLGTDEETKDDQVKKDEEH